VASACLAQELEHERGSDGVAGWDHLAAWEPSTSDQRIDVQARQQGEKQEQTADMGGERTRSEGELSDIRDRICQRARRPFGTLFVQAPRETREAGISQDLLDGCHAEGRLPGLLKMIVDVVDRQVALSKFDDALANRVLSRLSLWPVPHVAEEVAVHLVAEVPAERAERPILVSETASRHGCRETLEEECAQGLVLALPRMRRLLKEAFWLCQAFG
jgi:hypothetical protein